MRKSYRVKKEAEFQKVFDRKHSVANRMFIVYKIEQPTAKHFRVGISVGKKVGKAHDRVYVKRRIRQTLLEYKEQIAPNYDFLVIARPLANGQSMAEIRENLVHVLQLAKLLPETESTIEK